MGNDICITGTNKTAIQDTQNLIACAISRAWLNKNKLPGFSKSQAESFSFVTAQRSLEGLASHILAGGKFAHSSFSKQRKHSHFWASSQMMVLDFDRGVSVADLLKLDYVRNYAWLVYATPSSTSEHPKTRLVFVLDQPITDQQQWIQYAHGLYDQFTAIFAHVPNLLIDKASYSPVHSWAGSTNRIEQPYIHHAARLPIALIPEYNEPKAVRVVVGQGDINGGVIANIERSLGVTHYKADGWSLPVADPFKHHEHDGTHPAGSWHRDKHIFYCQKCQKQWLAKDTAAALGIEWPKPPPRPKRSVQSRTPKQQPKDDRQVVRHINEALPPAEMAKYRSLLIQGGTGLGKTRAVGDYINTLDAAAKITFMAQFRLLLKGAAKYINNAEHYQDATGEYQALLSAASRLLLSVSSSHKINRQNSDLLVIDELAGVLNFIVSSDTFKHDLSVMVYRILKNLVSSALQFIGMDANLSSIETDWINGLRGNDAVVKSYRRPESRGMVTLLPDSDTAIWQVKKLLMRKQGQVYVACSSEKKASAIFDLFIGGDYRVIKITRDTSNTAQVDQFIGSEAFRAQFDLIIYDPAMGSGVDISEPVYALVGIFDRMPLAPESAIQLFGRVRHAQHYYAAVPAESEGYETPTAEQIKADRINREYWTAKRTGQAPAIDGDYLEILDLWSRYQERHLREVARWRQYFAERLKNNGFKVQWHTISISKELRAAFKAWRDERKDNDWQFVLGADGLSLEDTDIDEIRSRRLEITHELRLRNERYQIERVLGSKTLSDRDSDLMSKKNRAALYKAIQRRNDDTLALDAAESREGIPLQKRRYSHAELAIIGKLLTSIGFEGRPGQQDEALLKFLLETRTASELKARFAILADEEATKLFKALGHQTENANTALGRLKWLLDYLWGIRLISQRKGRGEHRYMVYSLEADRVNYLIARRDRAAAAERQRRAEQQRTANLSNKPLSRFVVPPQSLHVSPQMVTLVPSKVSTGPSRINPFSQSAATEAA